MEGIRQDGGEKTEQRGEQGNGVSIGYTEPFGIVQPLRDAERKSRRTLPVKQPPGIVLLDVLLDIAAAAKGVIERIQRRGPVYQKEKRIPSNPPDKKEDELSVR